MLMSAFTGYYCFLRVLAAAPGDSWLVSRFRDAPLLLRGTMRTNGLKLYYAV